MFVQAKTYMQTPLRKQDFFPYSIQYHESHKTMHLQWLDCCCMLTADMQTTELDDNCNMYDYLGMFF